MRNWYATEVEYFGKSMSIDEVLLDKQRYFRRWPVRTYIVEPGSMSAVCVSSRCDVNGTYKWLATGKKVASGLASFHFTVSFDGEIKVVAEDGRVIRN